MWELVSIQNTVLSRPSKRGWGKKEEKERKKWSDIRKQLKEIPVFPVFGHTCSSAEGLQRATQDVNLVKKAKYSGAYTSNILAWMHTHTEHPLVIWIQREWLFSLARQQDSDRIAQLCLARIPPQSEEQSSISVEPYWNANISLYDDKFQSVQSWE